MSEQNGTPKNAAPRRRFALIGVLALVAGVLAGAVGIYVMQKGSGNQQAAVGCPADDRLKQALAKAAQGEVAAIAPLDAPSSASTVAVPDPPPAQNTYAVSTARYVARSRHGR